MKIQHISISRLFDQFDYEIPLANEAGLVVLTGPNGYGKTTILRILGVRIV
jgi:predicted ATP-binding protein involved in virulence